MAPFISIFANLVKPQKLETFLPWLMLLASLFITHQLWQYEQVSGLQKLQNEFDSRINEATSHIQIRMLNHAQVLLGFQGLFATHRHVARNDFHKYVESLQLQGRYPGIQRVSFFFSQPGYTTRESGEMPENYEVDIGDYTAGATGGHGPAIQADIGKARDSGAAVLSDKVALVSRSGKNESAGFLIYQPVYSGGAVPPTVEERRTRLIGFVTITFNIRRLMESVLGQSFPDLDVEIHDGENLSTESLIYDLDLVARNGSNIKYPWMRSAKRIEVVGHPWTLEYFVLPEFVAHRDQWKSWFIVVTGVFISGLLFLLMRLLVITRRMALQQTDRMAHQLSQSDKRYKMMFDDNTAMSCLISQETGRFLDVNSAAANFWGYSREELLRMSILDITTRSREQVLKAMAAMVSSDSPAPTAAPGDGNEKVTLPAVRRFESKHRLRNGEIRDVEVFVGHLEIDGVKVFHATYHDIGNRKQIELNQVHSLLEASPDAILMMNRVGVILFANTAASKVFRAPCEKLVGESIVDMVPESVRGRYAENLVEYVRQPYSLEILDHPDLVALRSDGEEFLVDLRVSPLKMGAQTAIIVSVHDVTQRKRTENALRKLERAVEQTSVSIVITDAEGIIEYVNPIFCEITGYSREEAIGQNPRILQSGQTSIEGYQTLWKTITSGNVWKGEVCNRKKNGELFWERTSISPVIDDAGVITNYIAVKEDITERKQIEIDLQQAKEDAEAASRVKSEFMAVMSHEIRTPMNGVIGLTSLLLDTQLDRQQREYAKTVQQSAESLLFIINDILDFSKMEAGKLDLEIIDFDLRALLDQLSSMMAFRAREKGIELTVLVDPDVPSLLRGDPGRLRQILLNLVGNALKFTDRGVVALYVELVGGQEGHSRLCFNISDTGIGISGDQLGMLFTPFAQADASMTRRFGGTGLGLAITKQLVDLMDGEIGVESQSGVGSTFWFSITFELQPLPEQAPGKLLCHLSGQRILVVDENASFRMMLNQLLINSQCTPLSVSNEPDALALLRDESAAGRAIDAAIIDTQSAENRGEHLVKELKANPEWTKIPLISVCSIPRRGDARRIKEMRFDAYLTKPVATDLLLCCLKRVIGEVNRMADPLNPLNPLDSLDSHKPLKPLITRHTLIESMRRASILLVSDLKENQGSQRLLHLLREKLGQHVEVVSNSALALERISENGFDLVLLDGQAPGLDLNEVTRQIRSGDSGISDRDIPIVALVADTSGSSDELKCALAAGLNGTLAHSVDAHGLDSTIQQLLRNRLLAESAAPSTVSSVSTVPIVALENLQLRLLLAEDHPVNQMVALGLLRKLGINDVVTVENGQEAIEAARAGDFDLILMDCQMPVMDGFVATRKLRETGCNIPIIAITAHAMVGIQEQCASAGMNGYLPKPIDLAELSRMLVSCLPLPVVAQPEIPQVAVALPKVSSAPESTPFNKTAAMERLGGDENLLIDLIRVFIKHWSDAQGRLEQAVAQGDLATVAREAHTIKGSSMTVGALRVGSIASEMSECGKKEKFEDIQRLMPELVREVQDFVMATKDLCL